MGITAHGDVQLLEKCKIEISTVLTVKRDMYFFVISGARGGLIVRRWFSRKDFRGLEWISDITRKATRPCRASPVPFILSTFLKKSTNFDCSVLLKNVV
jgi:hypothetical protein